MHPVLRDIMLLPAEKVQGLVEILKKDSVSLRQTLEKAYLEQQNTPSNGEITLDVLDLRQETIAEIEEYTDFCCEALIQRQKQLERSRKRSRKQLTMLYQAQGANTKKQKIAPIASFSLHRTDTNNTLLSSSSNCTGVSDFSGSNSNSASASTSTSQLTPENRYGTMSSSDSDTDSSDTDDSDDQYCYSKSIYFSPPKQRQL
jgi:hypothetical protein